MKTTLFQLPKLFLSLSLRYCGFLVLIAILTACAGSGDPSNETSDSERTDSTKVETPANSTQFPNELAFYNNLMIYSTCPLQMGLVQNGGPINCSDFKSAVLDFYNSYRSPSGLDLYPTKLEFDVAHADLLIAIINSYGDNQTDGLVFHYGYVRNGSSGKIIYILSKGKKDNNNDIQYCAFPSGVNGQNNNHYFALEPHNNKSYRIIDQNQFTVLTQAYASSVTYNKNPLGNQDPKMAYHDPKGLLDFYSEYKAAAKLHLYISHGAVLNTATSNKLHSPCFAFGNESVFFPLDDVDYQTMGLGGPFRSKGLDIGRLCPPHCRTPVTPCS